MRTRLALGIALLAAGLHGAWAGETVGRLDEATTTFGQGDYSHAVVLLREIVLDPADSEEKASAHFWLAKSYLAMENLEDGERSLEFFLSNYPEHPRYAEAFYEKGRLLFRQNDFENAIQVLQAFLERYPDSPFVANAYFWVGESLYSLGQLDDAMLAYRKIVDSYPGGFKVEPARYRIALIDFKKRENELLKLLKWSHEESLKTIEGFQRRETAYEQALAAYQRKLSSYEQVDYQQTIDGLKSTVSTRESELAAMNARLAQSLAEIERLKDQKPATAPEAESTTAVVAAAAVAETAGARALLEIKAEALDLKEALLNWIAARAGNP